MYLCLSDRTKKSENECFEALEGLDISRGRRPSKGLASRRKCFECFDPECLQSDSNEYFEYFESLKVSCGRDRSRNAVSTGNAWGLWNQIPVGKWKAWRHPTRHSRKASSCLIRNVRVCSRISMTKAKDGHSTYSLRVRPGTTSSTTIYNQKEIKSSINGI